MIKSRVLTVALGYLESIWYLGGRLTSWVEMAGLKSLALRAVEQPSHNPLSNLIILTKVQIRHLR